MSEKPRIGVIMGSLSDEAVMSHTGRALTTLGLAYSRDFTVEVVSAHRTGEKMMEYAKTAEERGLCVIVAGAGGSAHLPGMVASETMLPVLGVAITNSPDTLNRALGSMIGMPEGKPLATFQGEAGAFNAGLFAARLLIRAGDSELRQAYRQYEANLKEHVKNQNVQLAENCAERYPGQ